ncbi:MAG: anhydro-N-acetylmuramic acid kinase, partial [Cyclobacteriaceae bacterium]|nr:anhydro-N-acetylmuramic acid kinase [Cyclobacteriaceae bacterium]
MKQNPHYKAIGLMSGTSLDGLDIVYAEFYKKKEKVTWEFSINKATTIPYPEDMEKRLAGCMQ